jgi:hypothetical protein
VPFRGEGLTASFSCCLHFESTFGIQIGVGPEGQIGAQLDDLRAEHSIGRAAVSRAESALCAICEGYSSSLFGAVREVRMRLVLVGVRFGGAVLSTGCGLQVASPLAGK